MRRGILVAAVAVALSGCADAFTSRVDVVARAGDYELGVDQLAELLATGKGLRLQREVAEGISVMWVDYTILADRLLAGDSLLDSGYVDAAMWAEIQQEIADRYHEQLVERLVQLDSAQLDSVYAAGEYRLIRQILFAVGPNVSPDVRTAKQRLARDIQMKLVTGALTWAQAAEANEDPGARDSLGSVGVMARGEMVPPFENAAYTLAPGAFSPVTESSFGFHILWRPALADVKDEFRDGIEERREREFDDSFLAEVPERWKIDVRRGIGPAVREVGADAMRAKSSGKVLGSYRGGRFRVSDLARWIQAMPLQIRQQIGGATDSQAVQLVGSLMRNEALVQEARDSGVTLDTEFRGDITDQLRRQLALMSALLGMPLDTLDALRALPAQARHDTVTVRVLAYLQSLAESKVRLQTVPPFLADTLRAETPWEIVPAGVERVLERARQMRLSLDTLAPPAPKEPNAQ